MSYVVRDELIAATTDYSQWAPSGVNQHSAGTMIVFHAGTSAGATHQARSPCHSVITQRALQNRKRQITNLLFYRFNEFNWLMFVPITNPL